MHRTIDAGSGSLAVGGLLLIVGLFLPWYDGQSAWTSFESLDLVLAALGLVALAAASGRAPGDRRRAGAVAAVAAVAVVTVQLIDPPPAVGPQAGLDTGAWFSLGATLVMLAGAALTFARFSITVDVRERDHRPHVPAVDRRPATETPLQQPSVGTPPKRFTRRAAEDDDPDPDTVAMAPVDPVSRSAADAEASPRAPKGRRR